MDDETAEIFGGVLLAVVLIGVIYWVKKLFSPEEEEDSDQKEDLEEKAQPSKEDQRSMEVHNHYHAKDPGEVETKRKIEQKPSGKDSKDEDEEEPTQKDESSSESNESDTKE